MLCLPEIATNENMQNLFLIDNDPQMDVTV